MTSAQSAAAVSAAGQRSNRDSTTGPSTTGARAAKQSAPISHARLAPSATSATARQTIIAWPKNAINVSKRTRNVSGLGSPSAGISEDRQRARRVLDREVAVGHLAVVHRRAVPLVDRRVDDRVVGEEAAVEHSPADEEERRRDERRRHGESRVSPSRRARGQRCHLREPAVRAGGGAPARRRRRTGRTTGCRGRTSASGSARSRSGAPR